MTRQHVFLVLLVGSTLYALVRGGPLERITAMLLAGASIASVVVANVLEKRFQATETGILMVDIAISGAFLWLALRSARYWPLLIAALVSAEVTMHAAYSVVPHVVPRAYMEAIAMWSWPAQVILAVATWRYRWRLRTFGLVKAWKLPPGAD